jgi:hypothetical protein
MVNFSSLVKSIGNSISFIQQQIPAIEKEALQLIKEKCTDIKKIEYYLDSLYSLHISGFKIKTHQVLIEYLKKLDPTIAQWHKEEFEKG